MYRDGLIKGLIKGFVFTSAGIVLGFVVSVSLDHLFNAVEKNSKKIEEGS